jgi:hypothetical protein
MHLALGRETVLTGERSVGRSCRNVYCCWLVHPPTGCGQQQFRHTPPSQSLGSCGVVLQW